MKRRAFSLGEVVLATGLMALVMLSILTVLIGGLQTQTQSSQLLQAQELARQELEAIRVGNFSANPDGTIYDGRAGTAPSGGYPPAPYPTQNVLGQDYQIMINVQRLSPTLRSIRVDVFWDAKHSIHLETLTNP